MRAVGFLEGYLTAESIFDHAYNVEALFQRNGGNATRAVARWLAEQDAWLREQVAAAASEPAPAAGNAAAQSERAFFYAMSLLLEQVDGILQGYNSRVADLGPNSGLTYLKKDVLLLINAFGDLYDLIPALGGAEAEAVTDLTKLSPKEAWQRLSSAGHCSALIKVTGDLSDIMVGHTTWSSYYTMTRIYKHYNFGGLQDPAARGTRVSFSSYPGAITSIDDFYILQPTSLVVQETTNAILDKSLYSSLTPESALSWQRIFAANLLAHDGPSWVEQSLKHNSGTYNNQWMVVDLKRFAPGKELQPGLLTVVEMMPEFSISADITHELERGFFPSYNVPYFREIYDKAGYAQTSAALRAKGPEYDLVVSGLSYQLAPRAKIFRRDAGSVDNLDQLLRSNKWGNDTYTQNDVWGTLCARGDLNPSDPKPYGCMDAKVTSYHLALKGSALAVSGPSAQSGLPPFSWKKAAAFAPGPHRGMPDKYAFGFELQEPRWREEEEHAAW